MLKFKPKCLGKCNECLFHFMDGCVALGGEDYFQPLTEKQAKLILSNQNRFDLSGMKVNELISRFPTIV